MIQALRLLAIDFLSALVFLAVYAISGSLYSASGVAVAAGVGQVVWAKLRHRPVEPMQWMSLGLVVVLGGATMLLQTPRLLMMKPSVAHFAIAAVMLRRGWMGRYLPPIARQHLPDSVVIAAGYGWAALLAAIGVTNIVIALNYDIATWAWFVGVGAFGAKAAALALQYLVFRAIVRRAVRQPLAVSMAGT